MNLDKFFKHHGIIENPFVAEEARHDPVFERLVEQANLNHPDFAKILGRIDRPSTSVVFGEKGSGKTAIRLLMSKYITEHNHADSDGRTLLVVYDDLNPYLDAIVSSKNKPDSTSRPNLDCIRLEDHQDAILSLAVTKLISAIAGRSDEPQRIDLPENIGKRIKDMPRRQRVDLAILAALYDQPFSGTVKDRWRRLCSKLKLGRKLTISSLRLTAILCTLIAIGMWSSLWMPDLLGLGDTLPIWVMPAAGISGAGAAILWIMWLARHVLLWRHCRRLRKDMPAIRRNASQLREMFLALRVGDMADQPWPLPDDHDSNSRYHLTGKLLELLRVFDYTGLIVLVDRIDEPTLVAGQPDRMKSVVWPMLDNKFLQQNGVGLKLLLPVELSHMLRRESGEFFQEARLDKQNLIDPLLWSGATLYDLCSARLAACRPPDADPVFLTDLFEPAVTRDMLVDALDQMHQPRDAFKFLYQVIQEHCRMVPEDQPKYMIPRLTLDNVRRMQSQRVQDFYRGLSPA
jgi:hypothetical protein